MDNLISIKQQPMSLIASICGMSSPENPILQEIQRTFEEEKKPVNKQKIRSKNSKTLQETLDESIYIFV